MRQCFGCGRYLRQDRAETIDISQTDEYYPTIRYLCRDCDRSGGASE